MLVQNFAEAYPKTGQFIYIFKKVGLMNQAPTEESNPYRNDQALTKHKGVLINQVPTKYKGVLINQTPTEEQNPVIMLFCNFWQEGAEADQYFVR